MKKLEIVGFKRENLGKSGAKTLRNQALVPCVLYGGKEQRHFTVPMILFRELLYTPNVYEVQLNIEGEIFRAIVQDSQFHPVSEIILHVDFLEIVSDRALKMDIPLKFVGTSPGVVKGGKLVQKLRKIRVKGLADNLPDYIEVDISGMDLGKSFKVSQLQAKNFEILNNPSIPVCSIDIPRALRGKI